MAERVEIRQPSCPAHTPQASAVEVDLSFDPGEVERLHIRIPAGHRGNTGIAIAVAHQIVIPNSGAAWLTGENEQHDWPLSNYGNAGQWSAFMFNVTTRPHLWVLQFHINEIERPSASYRQPMISVSDIHAAAMKL